MKIPNYLKHKSVIVVEDYEQIDGLNAGHSDAKGLSLGLAQWNARKNVDISAKVWRHTGKRWSRQSEELPLHRVLDLTLLILATMKLMNGAGAHHDLCDGEDPCIGKIPLSGGAMSVSVNTDNPMISDDMKLFRDCWVTESPELEERIRQLAAQLKALGY
jgi:hypothetical protein